MHNAWATTQSTEQKEEGAGNKRGDDEHRRRTKKLKDAFSMKKLMSSVAETTTSISPRHPKGVTVKQYVCDPDPSSGKRGMIPHQASSAANGTAESDLILKKRPHETENTSVPRAS